MLDEASAPPLGWTDTRAIREARLDAALADDPARLHRRARRAARTRHRRRHRARRGRAAAPPERGAERRRRTRCWRRSSGPRTARTTSRSSSFSSATSRRVQGRDPCRSLVVRELRARLKAWLQRRGLTEEQDGRHRPRGLRSLQQRDRARLRRRLRDDPHHNRAPCRASFTSRSRTTGPGRRCAPTRRAAAGC